MAVKLIQTKVEQTKAFIHKYKSYEPAVFFVGGFIFDVLALERIDAPFTMAQQGIYLFLLALVLGHMLIETGAHKPLGPRWRFYVKWRIPLMHFLFGTLLNCYTLFYFKSSSLAASFGFLLLMCALLVANELPRFRNLGLGFKFALLALCLMSYFAGIVPIFVGSIGTGVFVLSLVIGILPLIIALRLSRRAGVPVHQTTVQILRPALIVLLVFLFSYMFRLIPPVPLSIQYIGVYHSVSKNAEGHYQLAHERPWWRVWHNGDQEFLAQPGDKVLVFFRLFSPTRFNDEVRLVWYLDDASHGWTKQDTIPIKIVGGREEGFRGYGQKSNFTEGAWRVIAETSDGREIGRIRFWLTSVPAGPREFQYDLQ